MQRMRYCIVLLTAAVGVFGQMKNPHTTAADVAAGAKIFRLHCAECHGLHGEGGRGPNLTTGVYYHGAADARRAATRCQTRLRGKPGRLGAFACLTPSQRQPRA